MKFINEVVNGGVTIILFVVTNLVCVLKKRNLSIFRGLKGAWKHIRTLEWKWKRDVTPVPSESLVNPISDRGSWQLNPILTIIFISVIVRKEDPTLSCSRIVALSLSTLWLRISQFYFSMGAGKGYNSAVECHLDVVEVISSSLIIPKPNVSFYIWICSPAVIQWEWIRGSWDWREGAGMAIFLGANSGRIWSAWRVRSWLRMNAGGMLNTCKSDGKWCFQWRAGE